MWKVDNKPIKIFTERGDYWLKVCRNFEECGEYFLARLNRKPSFCEPCARERKRKQSAYQREYRRKNKDKINQQKKEWAAKKRTELREKLLGKVGFETHTQAKREYQENKRLVEREILTRKEAELDKFEHYLAEYKKIK